MTGTPELNALSGAADIDLRAYRAGHVAERVQRALGRERVADALALAQLLRGDAAARRRFRRSVAVPVTGLFRDPEQFATLERDLLPPLVAGERRITVWSAGCADGSELYSVGLLLERLGALQRATMLGSDVLEENLAAARLGRYGEWNVPATVRARTRWEVRDLARAGPPPGRWQIVLCRNVSIYLAPAARRALQDTLVAALSHRGALVLGRSERLVDPGALGLQRVAPSIYRRTP